jgi:hypothetical protein
MSVVKDPNQELKLQEVIDLYLLTLSMFPSKMEEEAMNLTQLVMKEKDNERMLFFQVLPLTLQSKNNSESVEVLIGHLMSLLSFFVDNSFISRRDSNEETDLLEKKTTEVIVLIAKKLNWRRDFFDYCISEVDVVLSKLSQAFDSMSYSRIKTEEADDHPIDLSSSKRNSKKIKSEVNPSLDLNLLKELMFSVLVLFVKSLNAYQRESVKTNTALIETTTMKSDKSLSPSIVVSSTDHLLLKKSFLSCISCIDLIMNPLYGISHDFFNCLKSIKVDSSHSFLHFSKESCMFRGNYPDFVTQSVALDKEKKLKAIIQIISASLMMVDKKLCLGYSVMACEMLLDMKNNKSNNKNDSIEIHSNQETTSSQRTLKFLPLSLIPVTDFVISSVIVILEEIVQTTPSDSLIGDLIVLSQYQWPKYSSLFRSMISLLTRPLKELPSGRSAQPLIHRFVYLDFSNLVFNPDILEEFMFLANMEVRLNMELKPSTPTASSKSMTTRGVNKGVKEEVKTFLKEQIKASVDKNLNEQHFLHFIRNMKYSLHC